eukprot:4883955-Pyramimonas_sp.AAC.1
MRVYVTAAAKRAVVGKEEDLLAKADIQANPENISKALFTHLKTWLDNECFKMQEITKASNIMTSRYVHIWKFVKNEMGELGRAIRLRLILRGSMDLEAFDVETFSGTARGQARGYLLARQRGRSSGSLLPLASTWPS